MKRLGQIRAYTVTHNHSSQPQLHTLAITTQEVLHLTYHMSHDPIIAESALGDWSGFTSHALLVVHRYLWGLEAKGTAVVSGVQ